MSETTLLKAISWLLYLAVVGLVYWQWEWTGLACFFIGYGYHVFDNALMGGRNATP